MKYAPAREILRFCAIFSAVRGSFSGEVAVREDNRPKVMIFEDDPVILKLFKGLFVFNGHDVVSYSDPSKCPLLKDSLCECQRESPCADVIIADMEMRNMTGLELFALQSKRGCKAPDGNKLLLGNKLTAEQQATILRLGCRFIRKPFNTYEIVKWMEACTRRLFEGGTALH
ncbi:MAG: response regulator [Desulfuromonadales bacterium]|nr:response regulator [Desulfuromonadales bacterium]